MKTAMDMMHTFRDLADMLESQAIKPGPPWRIIESPFLTVQFRFPRSKRRRIRRKWYRRHANHKPDPRIMITDDAIYAHPVTFALIKREIEQAQLMETVRKQAAKAIGERLENMIVNACTSGDVTWRSLQGPRNWDY